MGVFLDFGKRHTNEGRADEPTEEEKKNGWTTKSLTAYLKERYAAQSLTVDVHSLSRKVAARTCCWPCRMLHELRELAVYEQRQ